MPTLQGLDNRRQFFFASDRIYEGPKQRDYFIDTSWGKEYKDEQLVIEGIHLSPIKLEDPLSTFTITLMVGERQQIQFTGNYFEHRGNLYLSRPINVPVRQSWGIIVERRFAGKLAVLNCGVVGLAGRFLP